MAGKDEWKEGQLFRVIVQDGHFSDPVKVGDTFKFIFGTKFLVMDGEYKGEYQWCSESRNYLELIPDTAEIKKGDRVQILDVSEESDKYRRRADFIGKVVTFVSESHRAFGRNYLRATLLIEGEEIFFWGVKIQKSVKEVNKQEVQVMSDFKSGDWISKLSCNKFKNGEYTVQVDYVRSDGKLSIRGTSTKIKSELVQLAPTTAPTTAPTPMPIAATPTQKDTNIMSQITIKSQTLINGNVSDNYSDDQLFTMIANRESDIAQLNKIDNKPQTLLNKVKDMGKEVADLVKFIDDRTKSNKS